MLAMDNVVLDDVERSCVLEQALNLLLTLSGLEG